MPVRSLCVLQSFAVLVELIRETGAQSVFFNHLYDPVSLVRDNGVKQGLKSLGLACDTFNADLLYEPWEIYDGQGQPFTAFIPFWDKLQGMMYEPDLPALAPKALPPVPSHIASLSLEDLALMSPEEAPSNEVLGRKWTPGEEAARGCLDDFLAERLRDYCGQRNLTDAQGTSQLSPHMHFGEVSVRRMWYQTKQMEWLWAQSGVSSASVASFQRSMGFREYGRYLSFHFPFTHERALMEHLRAFPWRYHAGDFKAWRQGATGFPLVDAGMRQLWATGWIHNRVRRVAAGFLVKHLLLPWQWGLKHYWDTLLDADLESAVLGWQFVSGGLPDGAPFNMLDNVEEESKRYDPSGHFVRRWVPQLARLPTEYIHAPWRAPQGVLDAAGVELGGNYPAPIVDGAHSQARLDAALASLASAAGCAARCVGHAGGSPLAAHHPQPQPPPLFARNAANRDAAATPQAADYHDAGADEAAAAAVLPPDASRGGAAHGGQLDGGRSTGRGKSGGESSSNGSASPRAMGRPTVQAAHTHALAQGGTPAEATPGLRLMSAAHLLGGGSPIITVAAAAAAAAAATAAAAVAAGPLPKATALPGATSSDPASDTLARLEAAAAATAAAHLADTNAAVAAAAEVAAHSQGKRKRGSRK